MPHFFLAPYFLIPSKYQTFTEKPQSEKLYTIHILSAVTVILKTIYKLSYNVNGLSTASLNQSV